MWLREYNLSRIGGVVSSEKFNFKELTSELISGITSNNSWKNVERDINNFGALVWSGWQTPVFQRVGSVVVSIDGMFYNRGELDHLLGIKENCNDAYRFAIGFNHFGFETLLSKINGDFSIALLNDATGELFLARDRLGVKPLYYVNFPSHLAFASRPKGLFKIPKVTREINQRFVAVFAGAHYRYFDNAPEESPYKQIHQLQAGHFLRWSKNKITIKCYWSLKDQPNFELSKHELAIQYRDLLLDAVDKRVRAVNGNIAYMLSGGLDSSSVLSSAVKATGYPQQAFSVVYEDKTYDESDEIRSMLKTKVQKWHPIKIDFPDVFDLVRNMVKVHDEPVATATWLSHYILCEEVSKLGFGALFGGLGGDELNAGEYEHFFFHFADLHFANDEQSLSNEIAHWATYHNHPIYKKNRTVVDKAFVSMVNLDEPGKCYPHIYKNSKYLNTVNKEYYNLDKFFPVLDHPFKSYLKNRTYQDLFKETSPCCLRGEDRQSSAFNINNIDPFFDYRLVEFMFRIPGELKIKNGITKILLRQAMKDILPEETRTRIKKTGWNAPANKWFCEGKSAQALGDLIDSKLFKERGIYNINNVKKLFKEHADLVKSNEAKENHMMFFWQLINLELWIEQL